MKKPNKILILHGWEGNPTLYWFPLAKKRFEKKGYEVHVPEMPGGYFLKYLETAVKPVVQTILIATPIEPMDFTPISNFFEGGFNWQKIKKNCPNFMVINENADSVVPLSHGEELAKSLGVKPNVVAGYSHFHKMDLDYLEKIINT